MTSTEPTTEAGKRLLEREDMNLRSFALIRLEDILAIEAEARAAYLASPEFVERLAEALHRVAYHDWDRTVDDPPVMDVGDLSDSGNETAFGLAAALDAYREGQG